MDDTEVCQLDLIKISSLITEAEPEGDPPHAHPLFPSSRKVNYQAEPSKLLVNAREREEKNC